MGILYTWIELETPVPFRSSNLRRLHKKSTGIQVRLMVQSDAPIAAVAALIADPTRARILLALLNGRSLAAGELSRAARVAPSAASHHLARLHEGGLLTLEKQGNYRYYRLASPAVGQALETLANLALDQAGD